MLSLIPLLLCCVIAYMHMLHVLRLYSPTSFSVFSRVPNENERSIERCFPPCLGLCLGLAARPGAAAEGCEGAQRGLILSDTARWLSARVDEAEGKPARRRGLAMAG